MKSCVILTSDMGSLCVFQAWVPRFGYKRAAAEHEKDWVLEVPGNADPYEDQFEKKTEAKSERVAKNELQRLKNIARSRKVQVPTAGLIPSARPEKKEVRYINHAQC
jgi:regulator of ribosome biosynthesis